MGYTPVKLRDNDPPRMLHREAWYALSDRWKQTIGFQTHACNFSRLNTCAHCFLRVARCYLAQMCTPLQFQSGNMKKHEMDSLTELLIET